MLVRNGKIKQHNTNDDRIMHEYS